MPTTSSSARRPRGRLRRISSDCSASPSGNGPGGFWIYGKSDERYKIQGGNQQIAQAQADYVGSSNIRFGWALTALQRNADGTATATFATAGQTALVTADRVILALPLGVMKRIKAAGGFGSAGFDTRKQGSIDALGFGANNKLHLEIADRFWSAPADGPASQTASRMPILATRKPGT